ncbi:CPBP family intramembrane glutamic endopeptidase [Nonomuraea sp. NPDC046802]|uniref:CPBP family intramembrane glutamic endopeptidase n=1 Tax=Nonomuraea sp. NPDC046802 TaxID=3154919 RepID=UPI00340AAE33
MAYIVSWLGWTPYVLSRDGLGVLDFQLPQVLGDSQLVGIMPGAYLGPLASAFIVTAVTEGVEGLHQWRRRLFRWRVGWRWYVLVIVGIPAVILLGTLPVPGALASFQIPAAELLLSYALLLLIQFFTTGVAEEPGWRDFALPRLQRRYGPLIGTFLLGLVWAGWHLPLFLTSWAGTEVDLLILGQFVLLAVILSIVITWVFNRTGQGLPLIILLHATFNNAGDVAVRAFFPGVAPAGSWGPAIGLGAFALVLTVATRGRLGFEPGRFPPNSTDGPHQSDTAHVG